MLLRTSHFKFNISFLLYFFILFLIVRRASGGGGLALANKASQDDHGDEVGCHRHELGWDAAAENGKLRADRVREAEKQPRAKRADGVPVAEDHGGYADEALASGHALFEAANGTKREESACQASDGAAEQNAHPAQAIDIDAERVGCFGVFSDRAQAQPPTGGEERKLQDDQNDQQKINENVGVEQNRANKGYI